MVVLSNLSCTGHAGGNKAALSCRSMEDDALIPLKVHSKVAVPNEFLF